MRYLLYPLGAVLILKVATSVFLYNRLIDEEHFLHISHGQLEIELQKRAEVYKKAAFAVNTYVETEKRLFYLLIELNGAIRTGAGLNAAKAKDIDDETTRLLSRLKALAEATPNLKGKGPYVYFMETIGRAEQSVVMARLHYNDAVAEYNMFLRLVPYNIAARLYNFHKAEFNTVSAAAAAVPMVAKLDFSDLLSDLLSDLRNKGAK
jgi:hypothetical protein